MPLSTLARPVQLQKILYRRNAHSSSSSSYLDIPGSSLPRSLRSRSDNEINKLGGTVAEKETISVGLPVLGPDPLGQRRLCGLLVSGGVVVASGDLFPYVNVHRKSIRLLGFIHLGFLHKSVAPGSTIMHMIIQSPPLTASRAAWMALTGVPRQLVVTEKSSTKLLRNFQSWPPWNCWVLVSQTVVLVVVMVNG